MGCREQEVCQFRWEWEVKVPDLDTSVFILPDTLTKTGWGALGKPRSSAWHRGWKVAGLPLEKGVLKGAYNLRYTFGRRLRSAGALEARKALLGHAQGDVTTHYSAAEILELLNAAE